MLSIPGLTECCKKTTLKTPQIRAVTGRFAGLWVWGHARALQGHIARFDGAQTEKGASHALSMRAPFVTAGC